MIYRIDVRMASVSGESDPVGQAVSRQIQDMGIAAEVAQTSRIFLLDSDEPQASIQRIATELLADPVVEQAELIQAVPADKGHSRIEIHLKPGVMDPVAASTEMAIADMGLKVRQVRTGRAYLLNGTVAQDTLQHIASRVLANGVIESVHFDAYIPDKFAAGKPYQLNLRHVPIRDLTDAQLTKLSREGHLFLSLAEMQAIQDYYKKQNREPTDIELETIAQTWSEHCVHKTLKAAVDIEQRDATGKVTGHRSYKNLIKDTLFASTVKLMEHDKAAGRRFCLSVFVDNAGVIAFDDQDAVCFKVETHNHPSAIEPYGGSATGAGGVIRDVLGTGLGARPVANTDVFCVAYPQQEALPKGVIHPKRILEQVVAGVRDYGNRMGIPTLNGAVYFDNKYLGNPLVFCGCVGMIPNDKIHKAARKGDAVVVMGGRTGRDGIHGATFSSAELTDTHADEFSHAVQIGNAITEKKVTDVIMQARDRGLFTAITDCGAGGLSSAVGEMGEALGCEIDLEKAPLKYDGLRHDEIWISEAQERMVLSVPQEHVAEVLALAASENVEANAIGTFGTPNRELILRYNGTEVGRLAMSFVHDGIPKMQRKAIVVRDNRPSPSAAGKIQGSVHDTLLKKLAHPNIASKHWIIRQYDHEVQGGSIIKPLTGPRQTGPSDASVFRPKLSSNKGVVVAGGMTPWVIDPYEMALASIDEAVRNAVCVGADPLKLAMLDNFCWPSVDDELTMGSLVAACEACRDAALAFAIPFVSGKDSLHNQFTNQETKQVIRIPNTLLISTIGVIEDISKCITMDLKDPRDGTLYLVQPAADDLFSRVKTHHAMARAIASGHVLACHDVSDGGLLVAAAEMCIGSGLGLALKNDSAENLFSEPVGQYLVEISAQDATAFESLIASGGARCKPIGKTGGNALTVSEIDRGSEKFACHATIDELTRAWRGTLDW